jgi:uncharacterized protein (TIGR00297 family)
MGEEMHGEVWRKAIPLRRDRLQSQVLVWTAGALLLGAAAIPAVGAIRLGYPPWSLGMPLLMSFGFAMLVWVLRAATAPAAVMGFLVCFILALSPTARPGFAPYPVMHPAVPALVTLFVLTFGATKYGRLRKEARGLGEARRGRRASQIVANLGVAALCAAAGEYGGCIAALAEAAADTVSSEIGQAVGGPVWLITSLRRVPAGTDGGVSLVGTMAGVAAAGVVVAMGTLHHALWPEKASVFVGACAGLFFDSLLGATVERWGWVGNDLVNFASTLFAAAVAIGLERAFR